MPASQQTQNGGLPPTAQQKAAGTSIRKRARASDARPRDPKVRPATGSADMPPPGATDAGGDDEGPPSADQDGLQSMPDIEQAFFRDQMDMLYAVTTIAWMFAPIPYLLLLPRHHVCGLLD